MRSISPIGIALAVLPAALGAQDTTATRAPAPRDSFSLTVLQTDALRLDPRQRQIALQAAATTLRLRNLDAETRPALSVDAQGQYQSSVTRIAAPPIPGLSFPTPPHDTYDAHLQAQQTLFDPSRSSRAAVERSQLAESQAAVRATLYSLRAEINEAFFTAASVQERITAIGATILDLAGRLREARERYAAGAALPGDTAALAATIAQREQDQLRLSGEQTAALARLSALVGREIRPNDPLIVPDVVERVALARDSMDRLRGRPEYEQFSAARDRLARQASVVSSQSMPRVTAFGRAGYGRPGLNMLSSDFQTYWLAGLQVHWAPWNWGTTSRDRELLDVQREIVATNEAAFTQGLRRGTEQSLAAIMSLERAVVLDDRVVGLREIVEREAGAKLREGVITAADYTTRNSELLAARIARIQHRVDLAQARATLLTMLGVDLP